MRCSDNALIRVCPGFKIVIIASVVIIIILVCALVGASFLARSKAILVDIEHVVGGS